MAQEKNKYIDPFRIATIYAVLENNDKAFEWLNKAANEFSPRIPYIQCYPEFEPIRDDQRYIELLKKLGLKAWFVSPFYLSKEIPELVQMDQF